MSGLRVFRVLVEYRTTTHDVVVRARNSEEAFAEAVRVLGVPYHAVSAVITERP
jgi:hypothetical protein